MERDGWAVFGVMLTASEKSDFFASCSSYAELAPLSVHLTEKPRAAGALGGMARMGRGPVPQTTVTVAVLLLSVVQPFPTRTQKLCAPSALGNETLVSVGVVAPAIGAVVLPEAPANH